VSWRPKQSLKSRRDSRFRHELTGVANSAESELTAEAEARQKMKHGGQVQTRGAQEDELVLASRRQFETAVREVVGKGGHAAA
jgi:hypothetical protein